MNNAERVRNLVNEYVSKKGTGTEMTRGEFLDWVNQTYSNISASKNNLYPTDISYNLYNAGLKDFPGPNLCLVYVSETDKFRLVGSEFSYTGNIYQYKGKSNERIVGRWIKGVCEMGDRIEEVRIPDEIHYRRDNLAEGLKTVFSDLPFGVVTKDSNVLVNFQEIQICGVSIEEETYRIFGISSEWADTTKCLCEESEDGTWYCFLDTIDECIGECQRLVMFEAKKGNKGPEYKQNGQHTSELSKVFDIKAFENAYSELIKKADNNANSKIFEGGQTPYGFDKKPRCDGADVCTHYGMGRASKSPYLNWWVVSIYYLPDSGNIVMGIEESRYPHLHDMKIKPIRYSRVGNKKEDVAVFYSTTKTNLNYAELYEKFLCVCEEVMRLGLT